MKRGLLKAAVGTGVAILFGSLLISGVGAEAASGWLASTDPSISKVVDLPSNQSPALSPDGRNRDCIQQDYNTIDQNGRNVTNSDCFVDSTLGKMGISGTPLLFNNTSQAISVTPNYPYFLQPIPNQGLMLSPRSAPVVGNYLYFYRDIRQSVTTTYNQSGRSYAVNKEPDFQLKNKANQPIVANDNDTLAYSSNGNWMIFDSPSIGMLRVNLATFDVVPFSNSLSGSNDYARHISSTAISDDGRYAAVASYEYSYFKVFDLSTCTGTTGSNYSPALDCQSRDYWPYVSSHISGFKNIYSLRFTNNDNIQMAISYNWQSSASYSAAKFELTAPGKQAHALEYLGMGDSYISGEGTFQYKTGTDSETNKCHLSPSSYPFIIGSDLFSQYNSIACSGALSKDITGKGIVNYNSSPGGAQSHGKAGDDFSTEIFNAYEPGHRIQTSFAKTFKPRAITLSVGGNNVGFADVISACVKKSFTGRNCYDSYDERMKLVKLVDGLYPDLQDTYRKVLQADPGVQLYVIGYPQVVKPGGSCGQNVHLTQKDILFAQDFITYLNDTIQRAADSVGVRYVDVSHALDGHRLCEASPGDVAINGLTAGNDKKILGVTALGNESYHPNVLGHQLLAQAILRATNNMRQAMPAVNTTAVQPTQYDVPAQQFLAGYPVSATQFPAVIRTAKNIRDGTLTVGSGKTFYVDGTQYGLSGSTPYQVTLVSEDGQTTNLGPVMSSNTGDLNVSAVVPANSVLGLYTLQITGQNVAGQTVEIDEPIILIANDNDYDGDGIPNDQEACGLLPGSGIDIDSDGIDDACDPVVGEPPKAAPNIGEVHLTPNTIEAYRP